MVSSHVLTVRQLFVCGRSPNPSKLVCGTGALFKDTSVNVRKSDLCRKDDAQKHDVLQSCFSAVFQRPYPCIQVAIWCLTRTKQWHRQFVSDSLLAVQKCRLAFSALELQCLCLLNSYVSKSAYYSNKNGILHGNWSSWMHHNVVEVWERCRFPENSPSWSSTSEIKAFWGSCWLMWSTTFGHSRTA